VKWRGRGGARERAWGEGAGESVRGARFRWWATCALVTAWCQNRVPAFPGSYFRARGARIGAHDPRAIRLPHKPERFSGSEIGWIDPNVRVQQQTLWRRSWE
jgi:hypothetical protein